MEVVKEFLNPSWKKIMLTLVIGALFVYIMTCFPMGIFGSPTAAEVLQKKPGCRFIRVPVFDTVLNLFSAYILWFPFYVGMFVYAALKSSPSLIGFIIAIISFTFIILYFLALPFFLSCLLIFLLKKFRD